MTVLNEYLKIRTRTLEITKPLLSEDYGVQPNKDISPPKWHLGHTSWFYEAVILSKFIIDYKYFDSDLLPLFNSYYKTLGPHIHQAERGHLSRPTVQEILSYRKYIDDQMMGLLSKDLPEKARQLVILGLQHEQQHQELLYMDIKGIYFSQMPPGKLFAAESFAKLNPIKNQKYITLPGGLTVIGYSGQDFCYDNELSPHEYYVEPFSIRTTLVANGEYLDFINAGGYETAELWLSDGWDWLQRQNKKHPLYWVNRNDVWYEYDFDGLQPLNLLSPVQHINFYEASAFARFQNKRLPTEFEWEYAAATENLIDAFDSVWQWTNSAYLPYPKHKWSRGPLGEYNSKFMVNQMVLRGGSYWTPENHTRLTYRNYYLPEKQWPFTGIRLAEDVYE